MKGTCRQACPLHKGMIKVKMVKTGDVKLVTQNEAHGLIEAGEAELYKVPSYEDKMLKPLVRRQYKIK